MTFPYESQADGSEWCWAACIRMTARYFNCQLPPPQCGLAQRWIPGATACCSTPGTIPDTCNSPLDPKAVGFAMTCYGINAAQIAPPSPAAFQRVVQYSGLVLVLLDMQATNHYVLVTGYETQNDMYDVADPNAQYGMVTVSWEQLASAYGNGGIVGSWGLSRQSNAPYALTAQMTIPLQEAQFG